MNSTVPTEEMDKPSRTRVNVMSRTRTGCLTCRRRKKKCDEQKPACGGCKRNSLDCNWPTHPAVFVGSHRRRQARSSPGSILAHQQSTAPTPRGSTELDVAKVHRHQHRHQDADKSPTSSRSTTPSPCPSFNSSGSPSSTTSSSNFSPVTPENYHQYDESSSSPDMASAISATFDAIQQASSSTSTNSSTRSTSPQHDVMCNSIAILPQYEHHRASLLSYYLTNIAPSLGSGTADVNPFIDMLVPLGLSKPLILHLLLAQSAMVQQAFNKRLFDDGFAQLYYADSLQLFKDMSKRHLVEENDDLVMLTTASLVMCLTEVVIPDSSGILFDHLTAAQSLLAKVLASSPLELPIDLRNFMTESYITASALNLALAPLKRNSTPTLRPEIERAARNLADEQYLGQLSGCWIELLLVVLQIHQLRQGIMSNLRGKSGPTFADNIIMFGSLQTQIQCFFPSPSVNQEALLAGLFFKQAVLLYLWTSVDKPPSGESHSMQSMLINHAIQEAISVLDQLPASARVNSSLSWPLTIIGCCARNPEVQDTIRTRLNTMIESIRLGSTRQVLGLLERVWSRPDVPISPWTLHEVIQQHHVTISFI
ncbi:fungal-specific transcription factor domain-containing protein [Dactylonectria macrodidyma]|uniref:Fungal-specific transcription factor domain-containing protein n=1 Tax=Dactylonectria macrodidyma TaxID=307937 RepID=A0A9P9EP27_9HYPO|nr:fungal-specific transcription factor domain-containing protein [Dactylonectria macrodidyma]